MKLFEEKKEFTLIVLIDLIRMNLKILIVAILGITLFSGIFAYFISPRIFGAYATILPSDDSGGAGGLTGIIQDMSGLGGLGGFAGGRNSDIFYDVVQSRSVNEYHRQGPRVEEL
jgi:hypothetical protein